MVCVLPYLSSNAQVRRLRISLPLVECLVDGARYFRPDALPSAAGEDLRPMLLPRITTNANLRAIWPSSTG
jgi:hypothetical protein